MRVESPCIEFTLLYSIDGLKSLPREKGKRWLVEANYDTTAWFPTLIAVKVPALNSGEGD
jgi:hypothetical protein